MVVNDQEGESNDASSVRERLALSECLLELARDRRSMAVEVATEIEFLVLLKIYQTERSGHQAVLHDIVDGGYFSEERVENFLSGLEKKEYLSFTNIPNPKVQRITKLTPLGMKYIDNLMRLGLVHLKRNLAIQTK